MSKTRLLRQQPWYLSIDTHMPLSQWYICTVSLHGYLLRLHATRGMKKKYVIWIYEKEAVNEAS
jgi:hypothetical protein